jgi:sugar phosphate isomerase/epimerase
MAVSTCSWRRAIVCSRSLCISTKNTKSTKGTKNKKGAKDIMLTRREFGALALSSVAWPALGRAQTVSGVRLGVQTYSFRELIRPAGGDLVDPVIAAMKECGLTECELWAPQIEPASTGGGGRPTPEEAQRSREGLRKWRLETPLDHFRSIGKRFNTAGITIYAFNYSPNGSFSDEEIDRGFEMAKALGAEIITASATLEAARRMVPFAAKHRMPVAMHNHSNVSDPNEFATLESLATALKLSPQFRINLDIGHFTAANNDAVAYIREHHHQITNLHLKDRKKNQGDNVAWGTGDTPIREVLQLLKKERWPIRAYIEYEHKGEVGAVEEVKKCLAFARSALA